MLKRLAFFAVVVFIAVNVSSVMAEEGELWRLADKDGLIKAYVGQPNNESGKNTEVSADLKKALEEALANRKSVKIEVVKTPEESDVQINSIIKKFSYMDKGPFKPTPGVGTTLLDMAATATMNYVEERVEFAVIQTGTGKLLWKDMLHPYIKEKMTEAQSIPLISKKVASHFVWKCVGKPTR